MKNRLLVALTIVILSLLSFQIYAQAPPLGAAADYVLFSTVGAVGNTGISQITGNVGTNSGEITGFGNVNGVMNESNGASGQCAADLLIAYNFLNASIPTFFPAPLLGNGQVLNAGVYEVSGASTLNMELILDAQNDPDAVFILRLQGPFSTAANSKVTLVNGALACNVFWKVEGLVDMASGTTMRGTVIANNAAINMSVGDTLEGRALSTAGAVNVSGVLAYTPIGCGSPVLMGPAAPDLVSAACYAIFSGNGPVTNAGITYATGDIGTNVGLTTGFNPLFVTGMIHPIPDGSTAAAASDLLNAYNYLNTLPFDIELLYPAQFGNNLVLTPHTYLLNAATTFTDTLFLDAGGQADAVFVIQINGALSTSTYSKVLLINGALVENVFWKVDGAVSINDYSIFKGTIVANNGAALLATGANVEGRVFSTTGAIGTTAVTVTMPLGCGTVSAPEIITPPENQTACEDGAVSFSVSATGTELEYQWRKGTENLVDGLSVFGSTTETLTLDPVAFSDAATDYNVVVTGTYPPAATSENVSLSVQALPTNVFAGDDETVCETCPFALITATAENYSSLLWTSTGDGTFDDETDLNTTYNPGVTDPGTFVTLCLHVDQIAPCDGLAYVDCMDLYVETALIEPVANAGDDQDICENQLASLVGDAQNYSSVMWSGGDGIFSSPNALVTDYTPGPGDILAGTVELCLTAELIDPAPLSDEDCLTLTLSALPTNVFAGDDVTICETCTFALIAATAENYSSLLWTTTGDGTFFSETELNPTYTPGITDPGTTVTLCLHAEQIAPCDGLAYVDCMDLYVELVLLEPVANAGGDQEICENQVANLVGDAQNYSSVMWSGGDGIFSSPNALVTDYTPGPGDILAGTVELCLTAEPIDPAPLSDEDCLTLTLSALPINVFAGDDETVCETCPLTLDAATAENYSSLFWTSTGDGTFDDETDLNATYTPGITDPGTTVTLCLNAEQIAPCDGLAYDDCMDLFVEAELLEPFAYAGEDQEICENQVANLAGEAQNYSGVIWSGGDGIFSAPISLVTDYTPGPGDILAGSVELCLTAELIVPNTVSDVDCLLLTIYGLPTAFAGNNATILPEETYPLLEADATNYGSLLWETSGDGTFDPGDDVLQPTYVPGVQDVIDGEVLLTLTAYGLGTCGSAAHYFVLTITGIPPTVEIVSPVDGTSFNYSPVLVEGTANDEDGSIDFVEVRVNGGSWQMATGAELWYANVQLDPCYNTIEARSTDMQGLQSELDLVTNIQLNGQLLELKQGWSYISSYIEATDPSFFALEDYILPLNNVIIMLNDEGKVFWPSESINTLGDWNNQDGYKVKSNTDGAWLLAGDNTENQTITVKSGVNIFPVLTNVDYPLPGDFADEDILIIFELQTARIYWPDGELYTLTELKPNFGYLGNFYNPFSITYPDYVNCEFKSTSPEVQYLSNESPWQLERTANVHLISVSGNAVAELDNPEFIGAFDANGMCIGYADVREKADNYLLVIYGDDQSTGNKDGAVNGEAINLVSYNGVEEAIVASYDMSMPNFDGNYATNGLSKIAGFKSSTGVGSNADISELIRIFPNPANGMVSVFYPIDGTNASVKITFTNTLGSVFMTEVISSDKAEIDISNLQPGVYFVKFENKGSVSVKRLVVK